MLFAHSFLGIPVYGTGMEKTQEKREKVTPPPARFPFPGQSSFVPHSVLQNTSEAHCGFLDAFIPNSGSPLPTMQRGRQWAWCCTEEHTASIWCTAGWLAAPPSLQRLPGCTTGASEAKVLLSHHQSCHHPVSLTRARLGQSNYTDQKLWIIACGGILNSRSKCLHRKPLQY